jgi:tRNA threonylcarbamoyladenosine biosynthesis protein TsaE
MGFNFRAPDEGVLVMSSGTREEVVTHSPEETVRVGYELASRLRQPALVLLEGELGSGKTTLVKGIVAGLGAAREEEVTSPSFTLVHEYGRDRKVYHADLYRVEGAREFGTLGLDDLLEQQATVIVEWGEKFLDQDVAAQVRIHMELLEGEERRITIEGLDP